MFEPESRAGTAGEAGWMSPRQSLNFEGSGRRARRTGRWSFRGRRTSKGDRTGKRVRLPVIDSGRKLFH